MSAAEQPGASLRQSRELALAWQMMELITRSVLVQAIFVAARLRLADLLGSGAKSADELAEATGVQPAALHRLLRALSGLGVVTDEQDRFALTPPGALRAGRRRIAVGEDLNGRVGPLSSVGAAPGGWVSWRRAEGCR